MSPLLTKDEAFGILMNIQHRHEKALMPKGFCTQRFSRAKSVKIHSMKGILKSFHIGRKYYCVRSFLCGPIIYSEDIFFDSNMEYSMTFSVDKNICVVGIQVPTQTGLEREHTYIESLYTQLLDCDGTRLTDGHLTTKVNFYTLVEITFNRPVYIQKHKVYQVVMVFNEDGFYPVADCTQNESCGSVFFSFGQNNISSRDGLIRSIIFTLTQ